jgi:hypothetical protein
MWIDTFLVEKLLILPSFAIWEREYRLPGRVQAVPADPSICLPASSLFTHLSVGAAEKTERGEYIGKMKRRVLEDTCIGGQGVFKGEFKGVFKGV